MRWRYLELWRWRARRELAWLVWRLRTGRRRPRRREDDPLWRWR